MMINRRGIYHRSVCIGLGGSEKLCRGGQIRWLIPTSGMLMYPACRFIRILLVGIMPPSVTFQRMSDQRKTCAGTDIPFVRDGKAGLEMDILSKMGLWDKWYNGALKKGEYLKIPLTCLGSGE